MNAAAERTLANVRDLAPQIAARALEIERARRVPLDLIEQLRDARLFRMLVPRCYEGDGLDTPSAVDILAELAKADGATAWTVMIGCHAPLVFVNFPKRTLDSIYARGPDVIGGGSSSPRGTTEPCDGGFRVCGRWSLASGCQHADWLFGLCADRKNQAVPEFRYIVLPATSWQILDTWHAAGLRGTGSHDIQLDDMHVAEEQTALFAQFGDTAAGALRQAGFVAAHLQKILHVAAVAVGIAEGALADVAAVAKSGRRRVFSLQELGDHPVFQHRLGRAEADVRAARAFLRDRTHAYWQQARTGHVDSSLDAQILQAATWIAETCARAADSCFRAAGAVAVYESSPLQRRLRDIQTLLQHILVDENCFTSMGAFLAGRSPRMAFVRQT